MERQQQSQHEGLPVRIEDYPRTGALPDDFRVGRALRLGDGVIEILAARPERVGAVLRLRTARPAGTRRGREIVTRVIDRQCGPDGLQRITLAILGRDQQKASSTERSDRAVQPAAPAGA